MIDLRKCIFEYENDGNKILTTELVSILEQDYCGKFRWEDALLLYKLGYLESKFHL